MEAQEKQRQADLEQKRLEIETKEREENRQRQADLEQKRLEIEAKEREEDKRRQAELEEKRLESADKQRQFELDKIRLEGTRISDNTPRGFDVTKKNTFGPTI